MLHEALDVGDGGPAVDVVGEVEGDEILSAGDPVEPVSVEQHVDNADVRHRPWRGRPRALPRPAQDDRVVPVVRLDGDDEVIIGGRPHQHLADPELVGDLAAVTAWSSAPRGTP